MAGTFILAGDIGGTTARFALFESGVPPGAPAFEALYDDKAFATFDAALERFLEQSGIAAGTVVVDRACLGAAGPIAGDRIKLTNAPWTIDARSAARQLGGAPVRLINDFAAAAHGIDVLAPTDMKTLQAGEPRAQGAQPARGAQLVIGAGTGLGVAYRVFDGKRYLVVAGEGGHAGFAPADEVQIELLRALQSRLGRVSAEHVVSGAGLERIHDHLRRHAAAPAAHAAEISRRALEDAEPTALRALDLFIACYGAVAGDHALAVRATGGVYIAGGIAAKILPRLSAGGFLAAFSAKGAHAALLRTCPVHVVTTHRLGLLGAAHAAAGVRCTAEDDVFSNGNQRTP